MQLCITFWRMERSSLQKKATISYSGLATSAITVKEIFGMLIGLNKFHIAFHPKNKMDLTLKCLLSCEVES